MKAKTNLKPASRLTPDSHSRLVAYTAAAGLGAFFGGQAVEGQVTESHAFTAYPRTLGPNDTSYFYLDIDGDGTNDFKIISAGEIEIFGTSPGSLVISPSPIGNPAYLIPWTNGVTLNTTTGFTGSSGFLVYGYFVGFNYRSGEGPGPYELGFRFIGGDGKTHFGYMNIQINETIVGDYESAFDTQVNGIYYNRTPNAAIVTGSLPPVIVSATSIQVGAKNAVTINFTSSDNAAASAFTLETSPVLGASANWTTNTTAVITSSSPGVYKAVTTGTGGPSQFFRIKH